MCRANTLDAPMPLTVPRCSWQWCRGGGGCCHVVRGRRSTGHGGWPRRCRRAARGVSTFRCSAAMTGGRLRPRRSPSTPTPASSFPVTEPGSSDLSHPRPALAGVSDTHLRWARAGVGAASRRRMAAHGRACRCGMGRARRCGRFPPPAAPPRVSGAPHQLTPAAASLGATRSCAPVACRHART